MNTRTFTRTLLNLRVPQLQVRRPVRGRTFTSTAAVNLEFPHTGSVAPHNSYILLHTHSSPKEYPAKPKSPLQRALTLHVMKWGGLVNFSWSPNQPVHPDYIGLGEDKSNSEVYTATAFSSNGGRLDIPEVSFQNLDAVAERLRVHALESSSSTAVNTAGLDLYVCTHGERDCRCGDTGGEVVEAVRREVEKRGLGGDVRVGEVAHVGGHKYAANMLVFPHGDWLGTLQAIDVPTVLDEILERHHDSASISKESPPLCPPFWRGRMGLSKEEQIALYRA